MHAVIFFELLVLYNVYSEKYIEIDALYPQNLEINKLS